MVSIVNSFLSYLLLMVVILAVAGVGAVIGINARKRKDKAVQMNPEAVEK